ncbi:hypothetical protein FOQG_17597 [Fusarium oxysporum f. sp. raphani 54005]|uniref:Uncharacterized protein n=1 Tax=Fusarium oxysporum f. sp. raphani 54005 TaxID=1089458 RepID=X0BFV8_FUSOX|nr:hypothetical protein FOQG_17597 [Fusarium oxysporum f. sp. raphani 54005]
MTNNARRLIGPPTIGPHPKPPTHIIFHKATTTQCNKVRKDTHFRNLGTAIHDDKLDGGVILTVVRFGYKSYAIMAEDSQSAKKKYKKVINEMSKEKARGLATQNQAWVNAVMDLWEAID